MPGNGMESAKKLSYTYGEDTREESGVTYELEDWEKIVRVVGCWAVDF